MVTKITLKFQLRALIKSSLLAILFKLLLICAAPLSAQESISQESFQTAFIFHALDKITWPNESRIEQFSVGFVDADDELVKVFQQASRARLIKGKSIKGEAVKTLANLDQYDLLYLAEPSNRKVREIATQISRSQTLLITHAATERALSMINLVPQENGVYRFEVNRANLIYEGLKPTDELIISGGSEMDVAELLRESTDELVQLKSELAEQNNSLRSAEKQLNSMQRELTEARKEAAKLRAEVNAQTQLIAQKTQQLAKKNLDIRQKEGELLAIKSELDQASESLQSIQGELGQQLSAIADKEKEVTSLSELISQNRSILDRQSTEIASQAAKLANQQSALSEQVSQIERQKQLLIYGGIALSVFTLFSMLIVYLYKTRNQANAELTQQNKVLNQIQTELLEARDNAQSANEAKSNFLANMSHEIRTPMNAIIGMVHLAKQSEVDVKQLNYLNKIDVSANSLLQIINDILDFSKVEAGELAMEKIEFGLSEVLDDLASITGAKIQQKQLEFIYDINAELPNRLMGDPNRLRQILVNLTNNATKFTKDGYIKISVSRLDQQNASITLEFKVTDTGIGMAKEIKDRLFSPFMQADSSTSRKYGGTGLGLAICKKLVEQMNGKISVTSQPGHGSCFTFTADFNIAKTASINTIKGSAEQFAQFHIVVLIKNDETLDSVVKILESFGCPVRAYQDFSLCCRTIADSVERGVPTNHFIFDYEYAKGREKELLQLKTRCQLSFSILTPTIFEIDSVVERILPEVVINKPITPSNLYDALVPLTDKRPQKRGIHKLERKTETNYQALVNESLKSTRMLIVEDNEINQEVICEILSNVVAQTDIAANGIEAIEKVKTNTYDCILMDVQMPKMDGFEATRQIRKMGHLDALPIIAMTANAMGGDREKCINAGMNDYVAKPIQVKHLFATLNRWLAEKQENSAKPADSVPDIPTSDAIIDIQAGTEMMGSKEAFIDLLRQFRKQQINFVKNARLLLAANDLDTLAKDAHNLKGVSANLFISHLSEAANQLDKACQEGNLAGATLALDHLAIEHEKVFAKIKQLLD